VIAVAEAQALVERIAASNILLRQLISTVDVAWLTQIGRCCDDNAKALHDFAAAHPETIGDAGYLLE
jgi:hypothetical protein